MKATKLSGLGGVITLCPTRLDTKAVNVMDDLSGLLHKTSL